MLYKILGVSLAIGLLGCPPPAQGGQSPPSDPDVVRGIRQVGDGDYDGAILTLDAATRRLSEDPARASEVAQAYLYLGIAYLGKGHEASARAKFREALARVQDLDLTPEKFAPKVIEAFEQARAESARGAASPSTEPAESTTAAAERPAKKGGAGKGLLIGGLVLAGAGGGILAASGGGSSAAAMPEPEMPPPMRTENFSGSLSIDEYCRAFRFEVAAEGPLEAEVTWTEPNVVLELLLFDNPEQAGEPIAVSNRVSQNTALLSRPAVAPRAYSLQVCHMGNSCETAAAGSLLALLSTMEASPDCAATFSLRVTHP